VIIAVSFFLFQLNKENSTMSEPCDYRRCIKACSILEYEKFDACVQRCFDKYFECLHEDIQDFANANGISPDILLDAAVDGFNTRFQRRVSASGK
jgi:hypothetical protein